MASHSTILAWRIPWTEEPGWLQSRGSQRVGHYWETFTLSPFRSCYTQGPPPHFFFLPLWEVFMRKKKKLSKIKRRSHVCIHIQPSHNFQAGENDLRIPRNAGPSTLSAQFWRAPNTSWASLMPQMVKTLPAMQETPASIPGSSRYPGGENGNPLQHSSLENPMDRGDWPVTVLGVAKSWTQLSN